MKLNFIFPSLDLCKNENNKSKPESSLTFTKIYDLNINTIMYVSIKWIDSYEAKWNK